MSDPICEPGTAFAEAVDAVRAGRLSAELAAVGLVGQMNEREQLWLVDGDLPLLKGLREFGRRYNAVPVVAGRLDRLGVPGVRYTDGPRGVVMGASTAFPVAIARAASWDPDLEQRVGNAIGAEARAQGANLFAGVCVNLAPAPGWGRSQESYGEEPVLIGEMAAGLVRGLSPWVMSCVKHLALNSMEDARFTVDVRVAEDVLREVFLPHFRRVVEAGVDAVMSAYNSVNGTWAGENRHLLTEILREDWGFQGFVMTDFVWGLRHPAESLTAGQDLEMPFRQQRAHALPRALREGHLDRGDLERAATRLLACQIRLALRARPTPAPDVVASPAHRELAHEAACRGVVLLRNEPVGAQRLLPLAASQLRQLAVLGQLSDEPNLGDQGSSLVRPPTVSTILDGLRERLGAKVLYEPSPDLERARACAGAADVALVVAGLGPSDEGEALVAVDADTYVLFGGIMRWRPVAALTCVISRLMSRRRINGGDRRDLRLHPADVELIRAVGAVNPRTIVVVIGGGTIVLDPWDRDVPAVLLAWYPGMEGGRAIADILLGDAEPAGRLPVAIPHDQTDLPTVDWHARAVTYDRWWGQRKLDHDSVPAAYPLGYGLGYTTCLIANLTASAVSGEEFQVRVEVSNTGNRTGRHVVQVYGELPEQHGEGQLTRQSGTGRALLGFQSVEVEPGRTVTANVPCTTRPLQRWTCHGFTTDAGTITLTAGGFSGDPNALTATLGS